MVYTLDHLVQHELDPSSSRKEEVWHGPKRGPFRGIAPTDLRLIRIQKGSYVVAPTGRRL